MKKLELGAILFLYANYQRWIRHVIMWSFCGESSDRKWGAFRSIVKLTSDDKLVTTGYWWQPAWNYFRVRKYQSCTKGWFMNVPPCSKIHKGPVNTFVRRASFIFLFYSIIKFYPSKQLHSKFGLTKPQTNTLSYTVDFKAWSDKIST